MHARAIHVQAHLHVRLERDSRWTDRIRIASDDAPPLRMYESPLCPR